MRTFISIVLLLAFSNIYAANITAKLDVNPVLLNDTFHLSYTASGSVDDEPDFSPIKTDFELLSTQQSSSMSMLNGNISRSKTWTLTLLAKEKGIFTIPVISFGSDKAPKVNVVVKSVPVSNSATPDQNFILEMESSQQSGFIQQQFIITIRLLIAQNINNYQLSELTTSNPDTLVLPLGKNQQYKTYRGSKQYIIVEKKFALFPLKAETLKIKPFIATVAITNQPNRRFYDPFNTRTTTKRLNSKEIILNIKKIPTQYTYKNWLPSSSVKLTEGWPKNKRFIAGEPITRTLTLSAKDLTSAQLPELTQQSIDGLKQYPDKPESQEQQKTNGLISIRKQKLALIPTKAGSYTLPAISIPWWNTKTNKMETARLASRTFNVLPALGNTTKTSTKPETTDRPEIKQEAGTTTIDDSRDNNSLWFWLSVFFLFLWLVTLFLWWRTKLQSPQQKEKIDAYSQSMSQCLKQLKNSCEMNNAKETKTVLLEWAKLVYPKTHINNLSDLARQFDKPLSQKIKYLNTFLYGATKSAWLCDDIYNLLKNYKPARPEKNKKHNSAELEAFKYD